MNELKPGSAEAKFADIIRENEPMTSSELSQKSEQLLQAVKNSLVRK